MNQKLRIDRLNSLLREVISDVISREVRNPHVAKLMTVTRVEVSKDLSYGKVYVSVMGTEEEKTATLAALNSAAGFIAVHSSREIVIRHFPVLSFRLDDTVDKQMRIDSLLSKIHAEEQRRAVGEEE